MGLFIDLFVPLLGEVSEWLKEHAWKVCIPETVSRVRIPPSPQNNPNQYYADNSPARSSSNISLHVSTSN